MPSTEQILKALESVIDPELRQDIVTLGMVRRAEPIDDGTVAVTVSLTTPGCPIRSHFETAVVTAVSALDGVQAVIVEFDVLSDSEKGDLQRKLGRGSLPEGALAQVSNIVCIGSGKGGVGKSTITANLAAALAAEGKKVGVLDADVWGYSIPRMFGLGAQKPDVNASRKIVPLGGEGDVKVMSIGFFVAEDSAVVWRGPMLHKALTQFLEDVEWGELDFLLLDLPPGTGDVSMTLAQLLPQAKFLIVTTPQPTAQKVARRSAEMANKVSLDICGVIENMSGFTTPSGERFAIFGSGGGQELADELDVPLVGPGPADDAAARAGRRRPPARHHRPRRPGGAGHPPRGARVDGDVPGRAADDADGGRRRPGGAGTDRHRAADGLVRRVRGRRVVTSWLRTHDPGLAALRRAGRTAIVMPVMFAVGDKVIGNPALATFAAFGSFAMLLLVDFAGPIRDRLQAQATLGVACVVLIGAATLCSRSTALAAISMTAVAFGVLFAGVVSSILAGATTTLLLAFILPVTLTGPVSSIPDRIAGWAMAAAASLLAIAVLWPAPARNPLRSAAVAACRALAARLAAEVAFMAGELSAAEHDAAVERSEAACAALQATFFATPYRPTGLSTSARAVIRLVDEVRWLNTIINHAAPGARPMTAHLRARAVKAAAGAVLDAGAALLDRPAIAPDALHDAVNALRASLQELERHAALTVADDDVISALDPGFRAQEMSFVATQIASNIDLAAAADRRGWFARMLGRHTSTALAGRWSAAQERAGAHVDRHSVWLRNSVRGAIALGLAVLVADLAGVQHAFWVGFGTLSVLRSSALNTGQNVVRGLLGTAAGFFVGGALVALIGTNETLLWVLLPFAVLFAGLAPAVISFAAGQAAFTVVLLILFNILAPQGLEVGVVRIEDVAIGSAVSLVVGLLFWPRGAAAALGSALAVAYSDSAHYLARAVEFGMGRCDRGTPWRPAPTDEAIRAAAASRRLDDAFRGYLAERGAKAAPMAEVTSLVNGAAGLRLAGDAVLDLWEGDRAIDGDRAAARQELLTSSDADDRLVRRLRREPDRHPRGARAVDAGRAGRRPPGRRRRPRPTRRRRSRDGDGGSHDLDRRSPRRRATAAGRARRPGARRAVVTVTTQ